MEDKLIVAVTGHPALYDPRCAMYKDRNKKEQAWAKVSEEVGSPGKFYKQVFVCSMNGSCSIAPFS